MSDRPPAARDQGKILVVDDDSDVRFVVARGLRQARVTVQEAETGDIALHKLSEGGAEGVETQEEKFVLVDPGCDFLRGFLCGAPKAPRIRPPGSPSQAPAAAESS